MKHRRLITRFLLSSCLLVTIVITAFAIGAPELTLYAAASAHQPAQATQPSAPSALPSAPSAPTQPQGPAPEPTSAIIPTVAPQNTPVPPDSLPIAPTTAPTSAPKKDKGRSSAFVTVVARPEAGTTRGGEIVTMSIIVTNRGTGGANNTRITVPLDPVRVQVLSFSAIRPETWVSQNTPESLEIQAGPLAANGDTISATLRVFLHVTIPTGEPIIAAMPFMWSDDSDGGNGQSNAPEVSAIPGQYDLAAAPSAGTVGSEFIFSSDLFAANEPVFVWYNGPDGLVSAKSAFHAAQDGSLAIAFDSTGVAPGTYSFVFYGFWTEFTATAPFSIQ